MQNTEQIIVFKIDDVQYAFLIEQVNEVISYIVPAKIPNAPDYIEGVISLRGKVNTAIDLRSIIGINKKKADDNTKIIIGNVKNIGFIVDDVKMIVTLNKETFFEEEDLPDFIDKGYIKHIMKVEGDIVIILDMLSIFNIIKGDKEIA